jgi:hypothetical protein
VIALIIIVSVAAVILIVGISCFVRKNNSNKMRSDLNREALFNLKRNTRIAKKERKMQQVVLPSGNTDSGSVVMKIDSY